MTAETIYALLLLVVIGAFLAGEQFGREQSRRARDRARLRRILRARGER